MGTVEQQLGELNGQYCEAIERGDHKEARELLVSIDRLEKHMASQ